MHKTDLEIACEAEIKPIMEIAERVGIDTTDVELFGNYKAKISLDVLEKNKDKKDGKLILVTAINPTKAGEGKSTTTVGLVDGFCKLNKKAMVALREPSLGPVFGLKGGATGGGYAQVIPMEDINLHFTGDMHAITTCNNLISACLDNHLHQGNELNIDINQIVFKRVLDMNDRSLREVEIGLGSKVNGIPRNEGFNITVASEVMAVLCLSNSLLDLKQRLGKILVAYDVNQKPIYVKDLNIEGALALVMKDAIKPNLVQTLEHNPVLIHGGPFANIAHGCNSVLATKMALKLSDYVITEAGFGADLGAEKFLDIKCRLADLQPNAVVIVATVRALKQHGGIEFHDLKKENVQAMLQGCENLAKHIETIQAFGLPYIVAINEFATDTKAEIEALSAWCSDNKHPISLSTVWSNGGDGALDLAKKLIDVVEQPNTFEPIYDINSSIEDKILTIATVCYGASGVEYTPHARKQMHLYEQLGWDKMPICMAKVPTSLSDDATLYGAPKGFTITIREFRPSLGAGFLVALTGNVMTMPGLPKVPAANHMDITKDGKITGLF